MTIDYESFAMLMTFSSVIFLIGLYSSRKSLRSTSSDQIILADRTIGSLFGAFTMTATWVGGGFINGTAEQLYRKGLLSCQLTFLASTCLSVGGIVFAKKMRNGEYTTMIDPIERKFGNISSGMLSVLICMCDICYASAIMLALGTTISVIIGLDEFYSICGSASAVVVYTTLGGMNSVSVTDVVQLLFIVLGLALCLPFAYSGMQNSIAHSNVLDSNVILENITRYANSTTTTTTTGVGGNGHGSLNPEWIGEWPNRDELSAYIDIGLMIFLGGYAFQAYFQRVLSATNARRAQILSHAGAVGCLSIATLPILIGIIAKYTDWSSTPYGFKVIQEDDYALTLPLVLKYLTPKWISAVGLAAIAAAVMSSADSCFLGLAAVTSRHIYSPIRTAFKYTTGSKHTKISEVEQVIVLRICIPLYAALVVCLSMRVHSIYDLMILCGDLNYVLFLPQLFMSVYVPSANGYGSIAAIVVGLTIRMLCGEPTLGIPVVIYVAGYNAHTQLPFRTIAMIITSCVLYFGSLLAEKLLRNLPVKYDVMHCFHGNYVDSTRMTKPTIEVRKSEDI